MARLSNDAKGAIFAAIFAIIYLMESRSLEIGTPGAPKAAFVPVLIGVCLLGCSLIIFLKSFLSRSNNAQEVSSDSEKFVSKKLLALIAALVLYPLLLPLLGFFITSLALMFTAFRVFEYRNKLWSFLMASLTTVVTYFIFEAWLKILIFPKGFLD